VGEWKETFAWSAGGEQVSTGVWLQTSSAWMAEGGEVLIMVEPCSPSWAVGPAAHSSLNPVTVKSRGTLGTPGPGFPFP